MQLVSKRALILFSLHIQIYSKKIFRQNINEKSLKNIYLTFNSKIEIIDSINGKILTLVF